MHISVIFSEYIWQHLPALVLDGNIASKIGPPLFLK